MPFRIPQNTGQLTMAHLLDGDGEAMVNTIGLGTDDLNGATALVAVTAAHQAWAGNLMPSLPNQISHIRTEFRYHASGAADDDPFSVVVIAGTTPGANVETSVPQNTSILMHKRTAVAGRQGRGRLYIACVAEDIVSNTGVLDGTYRATYQADVDQYVEDINVTLELVLPGATLLLFHNLAEGELIADLPTPITSIDIDPVVATQRRRLR